MLGYIRPHSKVLASQGRHRDAVVDDGARVQQSGIAQDGGDERGNDRVRMRGDRHASGRIRWVLPDSTGGGGFGGDTRPGATAALDAAAQACRRVTTGSTTLYDCAGRAAALRLLS